jgi:hypothetical protein
MKTKAIIFHKENNLKRDYKEWIGIFKDIFKEWEAWTSEKWEDYIMESYFDEWLWIDDDIPDTVVNTI